MTKLIIYFDYELQQGADMMEPPGDWGMREYENTKELLSLLDQYDAKACFATLGKVAEGNDLPYSSVSQIQNIEENGHEIGCHSYYHHLTADIPLDQLQENLCDARTILNSVTEQEVVTFVPPGNIPFNFVGVPITKKKHALREVPILKHLRLRPKHPSFRKKVHDVVRKAGFKVYREYDWLINRKSYTDRGLRIQKLDFSGFGDTVQDYIATHSEEDNIISCYGHPKSLSERGDESFQALENLLKTADQNDVKIMLPRDLI